jgi:acyl-coenzyme A thioesterase PaaI-like protein
LGIDVESRIRHSFARQGYMATLGAELVHIAAGEVDIALPFSDRLTQQDGFLHAGAVAGVTDSACGYAALTTMAADAEVRHPAAGERLVTRGRVIRSGPQPAGTSRARDGIDGRASRRKIAARSSSCSGVRSIENGTIIPIRYRMESIPFRRERCIPGAERARSSRCA